MPALRPTLYPRYRRYVCPSCIAKLQAPRMPPWLIRNTTSDAAQNGSNENTHQKAKPAAQLPDDKLVVKRFEKGLGGGLEPADDDVGEDVLETLRSRIAVLEADIQKLKAGDFVPPETSALAQLLSPKKVLNEEIFALRSSRGMEARPPCEDLDAKMPKEQVFPNLRDAALDNVAIPLRFFPQDRRKNISKLNQALKHFSRQPSNTSYVKELWKWYSHSRINLSSAWHLVPSKVWTLLWDAFSRTGIDNPNRMTHIRRLGEDIKAAGAQLDRPQVLLYLESLFLEGNHKEAISQWESAQTALAYENSTASEYWALGIRMLANDSQPERAQQATDLLINGMKGEKDSRVLVPIIRSWLESNDQAAVQRAWAVYIRLKYLLGSNMKMRDYDSVIGVFLAAQQTDLALAVFRDMMLTEEPSAHDHDSVTLYKRALKKTVNLRSFQLDPEETSWRSHEAFTTLPGEKRNKYFYGSWIKKLIGDGEVDSAFQVAGLMSQRDIVPDSRHMNGIIGAWLRSGTSSNQQKAEDLGWKMIGARLDFVKAREDFGFQRPLRATGTYEKKSFDRPSAFSRIGTLATIETFCILINYYVRRRRGDRVQELCTAIKAAKIKPNTSFLNDLLLVGAMQNKKQWTWNVYTQLVHEEGVSPDHDTFTILWQIMRDHVERRSKSEFPSPRTLFSEMVRWPQSMKQGMLSQEAYELILTCFGLADDQIGTLISLRAMQHLFDIYPNEQTVRDVVLQLAKMGHRKMLHLLPRRQERAQDIQSRIARVTEALKGFKEQRTDALREKGIEFDNMDATTRGEELIVLLSDLLRFAVRSRIVHPVDGGALEGQLGDDTSGIQKMLREAAEEMGVPQCAPGTSASAPND